VARPTLGHGKEPQPPRATEGAQAHEGDSELAPDQGRYRDHPANVRGATGAPSIKTRDRGRASSTTCAKPMDGSPECSFLGAAWRWFVAAPSGAGTSDVPSTVGDMTYDHEHAQDIHIVVEGSEEHRDPMVVEEDETFAGSCSGSICVHDGATFELARGGQHSGSLRLRPAAICRIAGQHSGSLHVSARAVAEVSRNQSGSGHVAHGGLVRVTPSGTLAGSLHVAGLIENRGTCGGSVHMAGGVIRDLKGSSVKQPTTRNGMTYYQW
jgi:hypothetical protein